MTAPYPEIEAPCWGDNCRLGPVSPGALCLWDSQSARLQSAIASGGY